MRFLIASVRRDFIDSVDWQDLEQGIHGDPEEFVDHLRDGAQAKGRGYGAVLASLLDPAAFLDAMKEAADRLKGEPGRGEDYETAVLVLRHLSETKECKDWLERAQTAAKAIFDEVGRDIDQTGVEDQPVSGVQAVEGDGA